mgnify:CR=1 FL=1
MLKGILIAIPVCVLGIVAAIAAPHVFNELHQRAADKVIAELGGWSTVRTPIGKRLQWDNWYWRSTFTVSFEGTIFRKQDLKRLEILNSLSRRNRVHINFARTNLTKQELRDVQALLPDCSVSDYDGGEF